jgi:hypothetical protein
MVHRLPIVIERIGILPVVIVVIVWIVPVQT